ncbi:SCP2 sterol-binding domain-containing protein [Euzebya tangerina]|uniref:SCP2 sterol-binding domain-containing protein n=1 Tax=Euzebya tangerina TaxID=591198 RepID=UPI000E3139C1|nr:SCP2 sterol-binding domain-containing protein [Euzebya tangerina]
MSSTSGAGAPFPSLEWMQAYADEVGRHPRADQIAADLQGRYRFIIDPGGGFRRREAYDFVVAEGSFDAVTATDKPAMMVVTASYPRWKKLLTGQSNVMLSLLMRQITVEGDMGEITGLISDTRPLLDCLSRVRTHFPHAA